MSRTGSTGAGGGHSAPTRRLHTPGNALAGQRAVLDAGRAAGLTGPMRPEAAREYDAAPQPRPAADQHAEIARRHAARLRAMRPWYRDAPRTLGQSADAPMSDRSGHGGVLRLGLAAGDVGAREAHLPRVMAPRTGHHGRVVRPCRQARHAIECRTGQVAGGPANCRSRPGAGSDVAIPIPVRSGHGDGDDYDARLQGSGRARNRASAL
jgi:hypothetical protein